MNDHLPECDAEIWMQEQMNDPYAPHWLEPPDDIECQCKKLRACEERVEELRDRAWFDVVFSAGYKAGYSAGYKKSVADAQYLLEEHVDSIGWIALAKMEPNG